MSFWLTALISVSIFVKEQDVTHKNNFIVKGSPRDEERHPLQVKGRRDLFPPHTEILKYIYIYIYMELSDYATNKMH